MRILKAYLSCPILIEAYVLKQLLREEKRLPVDYIRDNFGKTKVGRAILRALTTEVTLQRLNTPWEKLSPGRTEVKNDYIS